MINSVNSDSRYLSLLTNNNLLNKLSETAKANNEATSFKVSSVAAIQSSTSSNDNNDLSLEEHIKMMQNLQAQSTLSSSTTQTSSKNDLSSLDADGDGTISADEYDAILSKLGITDAPSAKDFFAKVDTNADGEVSVDELKAQRPTGHPPEQAQSISSVIDTDGDGTISTDEYDSIISKLGITDAPNAKDFFAQFDTNADGKISVDELNAAKSKSSQAASTQSNSGQSLSEELNVLAASMLNAYEANYQNTFNTDSTNLNNIA